MSSMNCKVLVERTGKFEYVNVNLEFGRKSCCSVYLLSDIYSRPSKDRCLDIIWADTLYDAISYVAKNYKDQLIEKKYKRLCLTTGDGQVIEITIEL